MGPGYGHGETGESGLSVVVDADTSATPAAELGAAAAAVIRALDELGSSEGSRVDCELIYEIASDLGPVATGAGAATSTVRRAAEHARQVAISATGSSTGAVLLRAVERLLKAL